MLCASTQDSTSHRASKISYWVSWSSAGPVALSNSQSLPSISQCMSTENSFSFTVPVTR